jgi:hypothetical protein
LVGSALLCPQVRRRGNEIGHAIDSCGAAMTPSPPSGFFQLASPLFLSVYSLSAVVVAEPLLGSRQ